MAGRPERPAWKAARRSRQAAAKRALVPATRSRVRRAMAPRPGTRASQHVEVEPAERGRRVGEAGRGVGAEEFRQLLGRRGEDGREVAEGVELLRERADLEGVVDLGLDRRDPVV